MSGLWPWAASPARFEMFSSQKFWFPANWERDEILPVSQTRKQLGKLVSIRVIKATEINLLMLNAKGEERVTFHLKFCFFFNSSYYIFLPEK